MVSATDPAAVVATFKPLRVAPAWQRWSTARACSTTARASSCSRSPSRPSSCRPARSTRRLGFIGTVALSVAIGVVTGWLATRLVSLTDDHLLELTISVVLAYGSYLIADQFHLSGVIATVVAAVILGNFGPGRTDERDRRGRDRHRLGVPRVPADRGRVPADRPRHPSRRAGRVPRSDRVGGRRHPHRSRPRRLRPARRRLAPPAPPPGLAERVPTAWLHVLFWARPAWGGRRGDGAGAPGGRAAARPAPGDHVRRRAVHVARPGDDRSGSSLVGLGTSRRPRPDRATSGGGTGLGDRWPRRPHSGVDRSAAGCRRSPRGTAGRWAPGRATRGTRCPAGRSRRSTSRRSDRS